MSATAYSLGAAHGTEDARAAIPAWHHAANDATRTAAFAGMVAGLAGQVVRRLSRQA